MTKFTIFDTTRRLVLGGPLSRAFFVIWEMKVKKYSNKSSIKQKNILPIINRKMYEYIQTSKKDIFFLSFKTRKSINREDVRIHQK